jgi:sporulation integral membrane protein YlbJ
MLCYRTKSALSFHLRPPLHSRLPALLPDTFPQTGLLMAVIKAYCFLFFHTYKKTTDRRHVLMFLILLLLSFLYLLFFPSIALESVRSGLLLWYNSVLPVLFPFMFLCALLLKFDLLRQLPKGLTRPLQAVFGVSPRGAFAILTGFLCGFPMGAKITSDLQREGQISSREARYLYGFVNNLSPAFLMSYLASDQLGCPQYRFLFLADILGAALLYGLLTSVSFRKASANDRIFSSDPHVSGSAACAAQSLGAADHTFASSPASAAGFSNEGRASDLSKVFSIIDDCILDTVHNTVKLGVYITLFQMIRDAFFTFVPTSHPVLLFLGASLEVTGGIHLLAASTLAPGLKLILINALCAFGGFSALAQTISIAALSGKDLHYYIKSRVIITLLSAVLSIVSLLLFGRFLL